MSIEENKALVRRWFEEAYQDDTVADELVAPDYVGRFPPNPGVRGREAIKQFNRETVTAFPDLLQLTLDELSAEGDKVVVRWTMRGTHLGELRGGIAPTGKAFMVTGMTTNRVADGRVTEARGNVDLLGLMLQVGLVTPPRPAGR
jgi:predicted ester cyclase